MDVDWGQVAVLFGVLFPSIILHEVAHGAVAFACGDDTAKRAGRLTLNPIAHVDPFGTLLLPMVLAASGLGVIGFAKPVPVNLRRLRRPRDHAVLVALAGPATNIALAVAAAVVVRLLGGADVDFDGGRIGAIGVAEVVALAGFLNVLLALFNLLPIPPLDGSAVLERALPRRWWPAWAKVRRWSLPVVLIGVLVFGVGAVVFDPAIAIWEVLV